MTTTYAFTDHDPIDTFTDAELAEAAAPADAFLQSCLQTGDVLRLRNAAHILAAPGGCNPARDSALAAAYAVIADHIEATR